MEFAEVKSEDFTTISREQPSFLKIEAEVIKIGGGGVPGTAYKKDLLKAAGWTHHELTSYGKFPDQAAEAFNRIRASLGSTQDKDALLEAVKP